ncbi:hypothetical protein [Pseudoduganella namucuonensis]|uniref:Type II secretion system protein n=1 Tax=Pseudoduganella namucuonensis TaxID=1035707 RepID=A0A1I7L603_9BURK|nr:hypothetical protein [Pseudoduganella namucuonensis]SFV05163.1 hypothetical protein SAMN05216552_1023108 [Pseudoduganella namucuonensis]
MKGNKVRANRQRGAVLLILLAVLALAGSSLLMSAFGQARPQERREQRTLALIAQAKDALAGFATVNGRLPRPAVSATDGTESGTLCATDQQCAGFLPWVALGIEGVDAWGKRLRYSVTPALTTYEYQPATAVATRTVQLRGADGELAYLAGGPQCTPRTQCAAAVILSHGQRNYGVTETGDEQLNAGIDNDDETANATGSVHFITRVASADAQRPGGEFDDLVAWMPLDQLFRQMRSARTLPN